MKKKKKAKAKPVKRKKSASVKAEDGGLSLHAEIVHLKKNLDKLWDAVGKADERIQDIEIHVNLLTRLLTTLCIEKFGMRIGVLKRLIKRIEKEAIRDSQILHLEALYKLPPVSEKKGPAQPPSKNDPWEDIS